MFPYFQVYGILIAELLIMFAVMAIETYRKASRSLARSLILLTSIIAVTLVLVFVEGMPTWLRLALFTLLSALYGAFMYDLTRFTPADRIFLIIAGTIGVFIVLSIMGTILAQSQVDLAWATKYFIAAFAVIIIASILLIIASLMGQRSGLMFKIYYYLILIITCLYIVYSTDMMIQQGSDVNPISAAIDLYLSFTSVLTSLFGLENM